MDGEAKYQSKNGKWYCAKTFYKCPGYRKKLKDAAKDNWKELYEKGITQKKDIPFEEQARNKNKKFIENELAIEHVCCYCGRSATYQRKNGNWVCEKNFHNCPGIKKLISEKLKQKYKDGWQPNVKRVPWNKGMKDENSPILAKAHEKLRQRYKSGEIVSPQKGKSHTEEEKKKISESRKKYLQEHPDKVPYLLNHSSKISYPEQYFIDLFAKENIPLLFHKQIGLYQLDFYNEELKKYIEVDRRAALP